MTTQTLFGAPRFNAPGFFAGSDFTPDGQALVALVPSERTRLHRFRVDDGQLVETRTLEGRWTGVKCLEDGGYLLWAPLRGTVARFDSKLEMLWELARGSAHSFRFLSALPTGRYIAVYGDDSLAFIYDGRNGKLLKKVKEPSGELFAFAFSPDGSHFAIGGEKGLVRLFERKTAEQVAERKSTKVLALAFSPDGTMLAGGHGQGDIALWQVPSLRPVAGFRGAQHRFFEDYGKGEEDGGPAGCRWLSFTADGERVVSSGNEHGLRIWDLGGSQVHRVRIDARHPQGPVMALSSRGHVAAGSTWGALSVWTAEGKPVVPQTALDSQHGIALTQSRVIVTSYRNVVSFDRKSDRVKRVTRRGNSAIVPYGDDAFLLVEDGAVHVASDIEALGVARLTLDSSRAGAVSVSHDRGRAAFPVEQSVEVWELERGVQALAFPHEARVKACAFGPDGRWLVSVSDDLRIWDANDTSAPIHVVPLPKGRPEVVYGIAVSACGWIAISLDRTQSNLYTESALVLVDPRNGKATVLDHPKSRLGQVVFVDDVRAIVVDTSGGLSVADAEKGKWLSPLKEPESDIENIEAFEGRPLALSVDGTELAYIDASQNVVITNAPHPGKEKREPFVVQPRAPKAAAVETRDPSKMFDKRLAGTVFLFVGKFQSSHPDVRTTSEFREGVLQDLGGKVVKKPKGITHFVVAREPYAPHVPGATETALDALIAGGANIQKLSEKEMIELFLPTFAEARAMLRGEVPDGIERWNRWRTRYSKHGGGPFRHLTGIDLASMDLRKALLKGLHFEEANLQNANLSGVDLYECVFRGADLRGANLEKATGFRTYFNKADLREAKLSGNYAHAEFGGADLRGADLREAQLEYARLDGANLEGAKLPEKLPPNFRASS